ncbi:MAG: hypothetical protein KZQ66_14635 [Candidatus Thiodiazotropha sp. (ex Lucinoma aequizonata)]|nr:hypothetical protein [Candidatus Thiodiazotropha sp. (ex Lucinoma aequizonata)]
MVMAANLHIELSTDQTHAISDHHPSQPNDVDEKVDSDHCCHGVLHLIGLKSSESLLLSIESNLAQTGVQHLFKFVHAQTPSPPSYNYLIPTFESC